MTASKARTTTAASTKSGSGLLEDADRMHAALLRRIPAKALNIVLRRLSP